MEDVCSDLNITLYLLIVNQCQQYVINGFGDLLGSADFYCYLNDNLFVQILS